MIKQDERFSLYYGVQTNFVIVQEIQNNFYSKRGHKCQFISVQKNIKSAANFNKVY